MGTELSRMREVLRNALPEKAFLKRDRGDALFITNAPIFDPSIVDIPGFTLIPEGKLLRILPDDRRIAGIELAKPPDHLCASLIRFRGLAIEQENLLLCVQGLKLLDMGSSAPAEEIEAFDCALRKRAALTLRGKINGGGLYAAAILNHSIKSIKENEI